MRRVLVLGGMLGLWMVAFGGCLHSRTIHRVTDVPDRPISIIETIDVYVDATIIFAQSDMIHQFWSCEESADTLTCVKTCGGQVDLACPRTLLVQDSR